MRKENAILTWIVGGIFLWVVRTLDDPILTVGDISSTVTKLILGLHELVATLEPGEDSFAVGVKVHLKANSSLGRDHRAWRGLVTVPGKEIIFILTS